MNILNNTRSIRGGFISDKNSRASLRDILASHNLIASLIGRDLKVRYHQTWLGWAWAVINPAMHLSLYYVMFGMLVRLHTPDYDAPYSLVLLCGLVLWMLFSTTVNVVSESLLNNVHLVKKVYFPRIALTLASTSVCIMDFLIALVLLGIALPLCGFHWSPWQIPILLYCAVMTVLCGWGIGCIFAVARLRFRDVRHMIPFVILGGFYASPVTWTPVLLPAGWQWLPDLNPVAGCISLFRHVLLEGATPSLLALAVIPVGSVLVTIFGYYFFVHYESGVIDRE
ncbi:ABC-2 type transporter [Enterobacter sp. J49]|uniref:ABC transporter permease n=1 Tax=Enterobacter sp. J49 TaxID=1903627 RepID=UPI000B63E7AB|nr:ABC transporter permease [Enterobacter sp. J49]OUC39425.1 ABC-2 type transporter [Enterobacter sp. J49]